jgi:hypothetical protein
MGLIFFCIFLQAIIFGIFSAYIAKEKNRNKFSWFVLGFFFSILAVLALIAVPSLKNSTTDDSSLGKNGGVATADNNRLYEGPLDVNFPAYQIFLTKKYNIEKNVTLEKYIVLNNIFSSLDEALLDAHAIYSQDVRDRNNKEQQLYREQVGKKHRADLENAKKLDYEEKLRPIKEARFNKISISALILILLVLWGYQAINDRSVTDDDIKNYTLEGVEQFLLDYPSSQFAREEALRIRRISKYLLIKGNKYELERYLSKMPNGKYSDDVRTRLKDFN